MAETNAATPPAPSGGFSLADLEAAIGKVVGPLVKKIEALEQQAVAKVEPKVEPTPAADAAKPLTAADVSKILNDTLAARDQSAAVKAAHDAAAAEMRKAGITDEYIATLPQTADAGELAKAAQTIGAKFAADFKVANPSGAPSVTGAPPAQGAAPTRTPLDTSKMTGSQLIDLGLKQRPVVAVTAADRALAQ